MGGRLGLVDPASYWLLSFGPRVKILDLPPIPSQRMFNCQLLFILLWNPSLTGRSRGLRDSVTQEINYLP